MARKTKPIRSDIAWSTPDRIEVHGKSLPDELLGHINLGDMAFLQILGRMPTPPESRLFNAVAVTLVEHGITPSALAASAILDTILLEEVGHVAIGNHWYNWLCERKQLDPLKFYAQVASQHNAPKPKPPFNLDARRRAGFTEAEISALPVHDSHTSLRASELQ